MKRHIEFNWDLSEEDKVILENNNPDYETDLENAAWERAIEEQSKGYVQGQLIFEDCFDNGEEVYVTGWWSNK